MVILSSKAYPLIRKVYFYSINKAIINILISARVILPVNITTTPWYQGGFPANTSNIWFNSINMLREWNWAETTPLNTRL